MHIRHATPADIPAIDRLLEQVLEVHHKARPDLFTTGARKYSGDELREILTDDDRPVFVAVSDGMVQGYVFCIFERQEASTIRTDITTLYIDDLCVDEAARGHHVGTELYRFVVNFARENGCYNLTLNVWEGNDSAKEFYEGLGLKPQKTTLEALL